MARKPVPVRTGDACVAPTSAQPSPPPPPAGTGDACVAPTSPLRLLQPITYAGVDHVPGDVLTAVPAVWARWMIDLGIAQPATPDTH